MWVRRLLTFAICVIMVSSGVVVFSVGDYSDNPVDLGRPDVGDPQPLWWDAFWGYRMKLTFDNSLQAEDLINFPVLVKLTTSNFNYANAEPDGKDLRFIDSDDVTELNYHIELWNPGGDSFIWVNVTQIDGSSSTDYIWMYYGYSSAPNAQNVEQTYDDDYVGVWHLNETTGDHVDSTSYPHDGTPNIDGAGTQDAIGKIGGADYFDGIDDYVDIGDSAALDTGLTQLTLEAWFNGDSFTNYDSIVAKWHRFGTSDSYRLMYNNGNVIFEVQDESGIGERVSLNGGSLSTTTWYYAVGTWNNTEAAIYLDGNLVDTAPLIGTNVDDSSNGVGIGMLGNNPAQMYYLFHGFIDEVKISKTARSPDWIKAQYLSMNGGFINYGPEEVTSDSAPSVTVSVPNGGESYLLDTNPITITWSANDDNPWPANSIAIYYDTDTSPGGETLIAQSPAIAAGDGTYDWDATGVPANDYYIYIVVTDSIAQTGNDYSDNFFTITADTSPTVTVTAPNGGEAYAIDTNPITITWSANDNNPWPANSIIIYYDLDTLPGGETIIAQSPAVAASDGTYDWDATGVSVGDYYIYIVVTDSIAQTESDYSNGFFTIEPDPLPTVTVSAPNGGESYPLNTNPITITWSANDNNPWPANSIEIYYDTDTNPGGETLIAQSPAIAADDGTYDWDATGVSGGDYYIYIVVTDDAPQTGSDYSDGFFSITVQKYDISLTTASPGYWVFVSLPIDIPDSPVTSVFDDVLFGDGGTTWDQIKWYDPSDLDDHWKSYAVFKPASLNDMPLVNNTMGFWIHITTNGGDKMLSVGQGVMPVAPTPIQLYTGWNLVGYPSASFSIASDTLPPEADQVAVYFSAQPYDILDQDPTAVLMLEGKAYWVRVTADCTWLVDP